MDRAYTFVFDPDPDSGYVVTCPALPGLVTWGATLDEARDMARDAMEGYVEVLIEDGEPVPESDSPEMAPRYDRLAQTLRDDAPAPKLEQITSRLPTAA
jgi:predicted RNase H-like HicB family nuclease